MFSRSSDRDSFNLNINILNDSRNQIVLLYTVLMHVGNVQARPMIMRILLESDELQVNSVL